MIDLSLHSEIGAEEESSLRSGPSANACFPNLIGLEPFQTQSLLSPSSRTHDVQVPALPAMQSIGSVRMDQQCVGVGGLSRLRSIVTPTEIDNITRRAHGDRHGGGQPFAGCSVHSVCHRSKSALNHLVRESTGGHCRRTAQELCVIRRSMQTLRARCRWVPHERMVVDALTKSHGNSVMMLQLLRDGVLSIVDETGSWRIAKRTGRSTNVTYDHIDNWKPAQNVERDRRNAVGCSHTIKSR